MVRISRVKNSALNVIKKFKFINSEHKVHKMIMACILCL